MKLLFDHNLSPALTRSLDDLFPGSQHVFGLGLDAADDIIICEYALANDFMIVTKDADYSELAEIRESSPTIIWVRTGNCTTAVVEKLIRANARQIVDIGKAPKVKLLILF